MTPLRFDDVRRTLPELDELRPVLDHLLSASAPDPEHRWAGSGELETAGARLVDPGDWRAAASELALREAERLERLYGHVLRAVSCAEQRDHAGVATALLEAAALELERARPEGAEAFAESAAEAARAGGEPRLVATAVRRQGRAARAAGRLPEAERFYATGHALARDAGDAAGAAEGAIGAGNVLEEQGRWLEAADWYRTALELLDSGREPRPETWHALLNLHVVTRSLGRVEESVEWLERAEDVATALGDAAAPAAIHNAWGQLHMARREFDDALARFHDALAEPAGSAWARINFRLNLGEALLAQGRTLEAAEEAREAEREALSAGVASKLPEVYRLLGRIAAARGHSDAFVLFEHALALIAERGLPPVERAVTLQAYGEAVARRDPERARDLAEEAAALYRELGVPGQRDAWTESYGLARDLPDGSGHDPPGASPEGTEGEDEP